MSGEKNFGSLLDINFKIGSHFPGDIIQTSRLLFLLQAENVFLRFFALVL